MDYEKKYKEAQKWIESIYSELSHEQQMEAEAFFPELKESEDEKIRKEIIATIHLYYGEPLEDEAKEMIAWLEKQGKQPSAIRWYDVSLIPQEMEELLVEWDSEDATWHEIAFYHADTKTFWNGTRQVENVTRWCYIIDLLEKQGKQKPVETVKWSPQEESCICQLESLVKEQWRHAEKVNNAVDIKRMQELMFFLKTLNPNKKPQRMVSAEAKEALYDKPAWSEEDEYRINRISDFIWKNRKGDTDEIYQQEQDVNWLKSLKQRHTWKPSEKQIKAFEHFVRSIGESGYASPYENNTKLLYSLLNDLKKL